MAKNIRLIINQITSRILGKISSARHNLQLPICISFVPESNTGRLTAKREVLSIKGETKDLSETGIAFLVDSIRLREFYLVGENRVLDAEIELPEGTVRLKILGQRYEQVGEHLSVIKYLIGASIKDMSSIDREVYEEYLRRGGKIKKDKNSILEFGTTKS
jgi:hypothetical protein